MHFAGAFALFPTPSGVFKQALYYTLLSIMEINLSIYLLRDGGQVFSFNCIATEITTRITR